MIQGSINTTDSTRQLRGNTEPIYFLKSRRQRYNQSRTARQATQHSAKSCLGLRRLSHHRLAARSYNTNHPDFNVSEFTNPDSKDPE